MPAVREAPAASSVPPAPRLFLEAPSPLGHSENLKHERDPMLNQREAWELSSPVLRDALAAPVAETAKGAVRSEHNRAATAEANKGPHSKREWTPSLPMAENGCASSGALLHTAKAVFFNSGSARLRSVPT